MKRNGLKDYMLGDFVSVKAEHGRRVAAKVCGNTGKALLDEWGDVYIDPKPLPVTEKRLEAFCFRFENDTPDGKAYSLPDDELWGYYEAGTFYTAFSPRTQPDDGAAIRHVHVLQHVMRFRGLEDEADNPDLEKLK